MNEKKRITAKDAAMYAKQYLEEIYGPRTDLTIEEIETDEVRKHWFITLGYMEQPPAPFAFLPRKTYKTFTIDAFTGEVLAMKIREVK